MANVPADAGGLTPEFLEENQAFLADTKNGGVGLYVVAGERADPTMVAVWAKFFLAIPLIYLAAVFFPKLALATLYLSIFTQKPFRYACWIIGVVVVCN